MSRIIRAGEQTGSVRSRGDCMVTKLKYGNTNTFYVPGTKGGILVDTDYAGSLSMFYRALKQNGLTVAQIDHVMATHFHPDHMGLIGELTEMGVKLLLVDVQKDHVHFSDGIFARDGLSFVPIDDSLATVISCEESRGFLLSLGIAGEIIHTPCHSEDSVCLMLDDGDCIAGDLEPCEYIAAYGENDKLKSDWDRVLSFSPKRIFFSHMPERELQ